MMHSASAARLSSPSKFIGPAGASAMLLTAFLLGGGVARAAETHGQEPVSPQAQAQAARLEPTPEQALEELHHEEEWLLVSKHLPDPATASAAELEMAGDVLRARRFPEQAMEFYVDALRKGAANQGRVMNKLGVTELSLHHMGSAKAYFKLVVKKNKRDADGWNNLGATEYMESNYGASVTAYRKAVKLNAASAIYHANLGTALISEKDFEDARKEYAVALDLDPEFGSRGTGATGISAHVLSADDHARFCLEMARIYAARGKVDLMLHSLAMAADNGMDLGDMLRADLALAKYRKDPRVVLMIQNSKAMRKNSVASLGPLAPLPPEANKAD